MKKIFSLFFLIILGIFVYFGYPIIKNRYFNDKPKIIQNETPAEETDFNIPEEKIDNEGEIKSDSIGITISPSDCNNECSNFKKENELEYCRHACGLSNFEQEDAKNQSSTDCTVISGLQKDYCLKNLAIEKKDYKMCDQINDSGIKKTCKNRVTEDIIESQKNSQ